MNGHLGSIKGKRVLILVENLSVPFDRRVWLEAQTLSQAGYSVSIICPRGKECDTRFREVIKGILIYRFWGVEGSTGLGYCLEYSVALVQMFLLSLVLFFIRGGLDVIQLCNPPDFLFVIAAPFKLLGKKIIFDQHDLVPELYKVKTNQEPQGIVLRVLEYCQKLTFILSDVVITTNDVFKSKAVSHHLADEHRVVVIRSGPELIDFRIDVNDHGYRKGKSFLIFYVGSMNSQDGVDYLLRSIKHLTCNRQDFHVVIVGSGAELTHLKKLSHQLHLSDTVTFTGQMIYTHMIPLLLSADVCVSPDPKSSLNDAMSMLKILDYMAAAKPIVAYDLTETMRTAGNSAIYAKGNDERDFASKLSHLLDSPSLRRSMGQAGFMRIKHQFSWAHSRPHLFQAYAMTTME